MTTRREFLIALTSALEQVAEGDYSIRVRGAADDDSLGAVVREVNTLGETLRQQRLAEHAQDGHAVDAAGDHEVDQRDDLWLRLAPSSDIHCRCDQAQPRLSIPQARNSGQGAIYGLAGAPNDGVIVPTLGAQSGPARVTKIAGDKHRLALMSELAHSVIVCNGEGRILLYNARAMQLLRKPLEASAGGQGHRGADDGAGHLLVESVHNPQAHGRE